MGFDFHVHGFWIIGSAMFFIGSMFAGNMEWVEGTTELSYGLTAFISFILFLIAGLLWISSAVNARAEEK